MKVRILKQWIAAGNAKPGDVVEVDDQFIEHGMATGLCEEAKARPAEEEVVKVADTPETPKKRAYRK